MATEPSCGTGLSGILMNACFLVLLLLWGSAHAEPRALPPVVDYSTYPRSTSAGAKPSVNQSVYETLGRLEQLQTEVQQLRGEVEEQAYTILELKTRLKNIYADFDQRLTAIEGGEIDGVASQDAQAQQQPVVAEKPQSVEPVKAKPSGNEKQQYQKAYETLRNGHYNQAIKLFNQLLVNYPGGQFAANSQYWLGEAYKVNKDVKFAQQAFNKVISDYPDSEKVPDAMLKLGYLELEQNNPARARDLLTGVTVRFPGTTAAHLATKKLAQLNN